MAFDWGTDVNQATEDAIGRLPQYNSGNFNAATNPRGLAGGGHITNFPAALTDTATTANGFKLFADLMAGYANSASGSAANALSAIANLSGTSASSVALSTGPKSISTQAGKTWPAGTLLLLTSDANPTTHWMVGQVTAYAGTALSVDVKLFSGSGSRADWTIRAAGWPGRAAGLQYIWSTTTTATDPSSGRIKVNASPGAATALYISETDFDANSLSALIATWDDSTSATKGRIVIQSITQPSNFAVYELTGSITDNGAWDTLPVTALATGGTLADGSQVAVFFVPRGDPGTAGPTGPSYVATSATSNSIGVGSKVFTTQSGLAYAAGVRARATDTANINNYVEGVVSSYAGTALTISVDTTSGAGTIASWNINVAGERGVTGSTGAAGDDAGFEYQFNTSVAGDPGLGKFNFNNATFMAATVFGISETDNNANILTALLAAMDDSAGTNKCLVVIIKQGGAAYFAFHITGILTDQGAFDLFPIVPISSSGTIVNNDVCHVIFHPLEKGDVGSTGSPGPTTAPTWTFDSATSASDPGSNKFKLNSATISSVTSIVISETGQGGGDLSAWLASFDDSTNASHRGTLYIIQANDSSKYAIFTTGTVTDSGPFDQIALTYVAGPGGFTNGAVCAMSFTRSGNAGAGSGDVVGPASATNNGIVIWDGTTGKLVKNSAAVGNLAYLNTVGNTEIGTNVVTLDKLATQAAGTVLANTSGGAAIPTATTISTTFKTALALVKADVGLGNVDNTSDANKPVSTAQAAINLINRFVTVRAATTANITISTGAATGAIIDGVTLAAGDLVLVKNQTSTAQNGVYLVSGSPARHSEYDTYNEHPGCFVTVQEGTVNADTLWQCTSNRGGTLDTTALTFTQLVLSGYTADGATLTLTGSQFSINLNNANVWLASQTFINANGIQIRDTDASHTLGITLGSNLTANRTLTLNPGDANRAITLGGDISTAGSVTISGAFAATFVLASATNVTFPASGTLATTDASSLTSGTLPDTRLSSAATPYGLQAIWIPASACVARTTNGAAPFTLEIGTAPNTQMLYGYDFDPSTAEAIQFFWGMPPQWNENVVAFKVHWTVASGTGGVAFSLKGRAASNDDAMAGTWGTAITVTDTILAANDEHVTAISANVTVGNTPVAEDLVFFELQREVANASDTAAVDARVLGITLYITTDAGHD